MSVSRHILVRAILKTSERGGRGDLMSLLIAARVWVIVNARVSGQLVGSAEAFTTARELARMWLFSCMSANVSCLMFQTVEGSIAQGAFVRARKILPVVVVVGLGRYRRRQQADGGSHVRVSLRRRRGSIRGLCAGVGSVLLGRPRGGHSDGVWRGRRRRRVEEGSKVYCRRRGLHSSEREGEASVSPR